jgi:hypothetical protein
VSRVCSWALEEEQSDSSREIGLGSAGSSRIGKEFRSDLFCLLAQGFIFRLPVLDRAKGRDDILRLGVYNSIRIGVDLRSAQGGVRGEIGKEGVQGRFDPVRVEGQLFSNLTESGLIFGRVLEVDRGQLGVDRIDLFEVLCQASTGLFGEVFEQRTLGVGNVLSGSIDESLEAIELGQGLLDVSLKVEDFEEASASMPHFLLDPENIPVRLSTEYTSLKGVSFGLHRLGCGCAIDTHNHRTSTS